MLMTIYVVVEEEYGGANVLGAFYNRDAAAEYIENIDYNVSGDDVSIHETELGDSNC